MQAPREAPLRKAHLASLIIHLSLREGDYPDSQVSSDIVTKVDGTDNAPSSQEVFKTMIRDHISPAMRQLSFKGSSGRYGFTSGDWISRVEVQKSTSNSKDDVEFTFNLMVHHVPTIPTGRPCGIWSMRLGRLTPLETDYWWRINTSTQIEDTTESVITALREYGWRAIRAVMSIATPPKPQVPPVMVLSLAGQWEESRVHWDSERVEYRERARLLPILRDCPIDELIEWTYSDTDYIRREAVEILATRAREDRRTSARLVEVLISEEELLFRQSVAISLAHVKGFPEIDVALKKATRDECFEVRWAAIFALMVRHGRVR